MTHARLYMVAISNRDIAIIITQYFQLVIEYISEIRMHLMAKRNAGITFGR